MIKKFITLPVAATAIAILMVIMGVIGMQKLPILRFPDIAPPGVIVSFSYPGANAEIVGRTVLRPIEEAINGVENMNYVSSQGWSGGGEIKVYFSNNSDPDINVVNVQNRLSQATNLLPPEVTQYGVKIEKLRGGNVMTIDLYSDSKNYDETFLQAYSNINITPEINRTKGVAYVWKVGSRDYAMRIWLNPAKMAGYGITPDDVKDAIKNNNFEIAPGKFGQNTQEEVETSIRYRGRFIYPEEYENIILKANKDGTFLYLKDISRVEFGTSNLNTESKVNGKAGITLNVAQTNGSNATEIDKLVREKLSVIEKKLPKGLHFQITYSVKDQIEEAIHQIVHTLFEAFVLVSIIVFLFLQNWRATLIPAISIPVSLVATFFFLNLFGFSINILTLFAIVLAIGIVVDDAIVVVEAVYEKLEHTQLSVRKATQEVMGEITGAIISITLVMALVFIPSGFISGPVGAFYKQFAYTLAIAIVISALNALTLTPVLCVFFIRRSDVEKVLDDKGKSKNWLNRFFASFNLVFGHLTENYGKKLSQLVSKKSWVLGGLAILTLAAFFLMKRTPTAFVPTEDDNFLGYVVELPPAASQQRTNIILQRADSIIKAKKYIKNISSSVGMWGSNFATEYLELKPYEERGNIKDIHVLMDSLQSELSSSLPEGKFNVYQRPTITGFGNTDGISFALQDRTAGDLKIFSQVADKLVSKLKKRPEIGVVSNTFRMDYPQYQIDVDYQKANFLNVSPLLLMRNIATYYGRSDVGTFTRFGRIYRIYVQSDFGYRANPESINSMYITNSKGDRIPINTLVKVSRVFGTENVFHHNLYNAINISALPASGYSTGQAMQAIQETADKELADNYSFEWTGMSLEEHNSGSDTVFIFAISILLVYFVLAIQYESYLLPIAVLLAVPTALLGVFVSINLAGITNNIYVQVGMIMLVGLIAKNAILIIEFSSKQHNAGSSIVTAAIEGAKMRLRPILMTSIAFIVGLIPLMWTVGPSAQGNHSISIGTAGGMLVGTICGCFLTPLLYILFATMDEKIKKIVKLQD